MRWCGPAVAAFSFANCMWIGPASSGNARISIIAVNLVALGFIALAVTQTIAYMVRSDLVERRTRACGSFIRQRCRAVWPAINAVLQIYR